MNMFGVRVYERVYGCFVYESVCFFFNISSLDVVVFLFAADVNNNVVVVVGCLVGCGVYFGVSVFMFCAWVLVSFCFCTVLCYCCCFSLLLPACFCCFCYLFDCLAGWLVLCLYNKIYHFIHHSVAVLRGRRAYSYTPLSVEFVLKKVYIYIENLFIFLLF